MHQPKEIALRFFGCLQPDDERVGVPRLVLSREVDRNFTIRERVQFRSRFPGRAFVDLLQEAEPFADGKRDCGMLLVAADATGEVPEIWRESRGHLRVSQVAKV